MATTVTISSCTPNYNDNVELNGDTVWVGEDTNQTDDIDQPQTDTNLSAKDLGN